MISNSFLFEIKGILEKNKRFSSNDFTTSTDQNNLIILYTYNEKYYFNIKIPEVTSKLTRTEKETNNLGFTSTQKEIEYYAYEFSGQVSPGNISNVENINFEGKSMLLTHLNEWLKNLRNELTVQPELRKLNDLEKEIQNLNEKFSSVSEENFSKEEVEKLIEKLNKLEEQFKEKLV